MGGNWFARVCNRVRASRGGQATVEAAFALPVVLGLVLMLVQPGIILYDELIMKSAAAQGCRLLATLSSDDVSSCERFVRNRLSAVPQQSLFHVHDQTCTWDIECTGCESDEEVSVSIATKIRPVPLIGFGLGLFGLTDSDGLFTIRASESMTTQPSWVRASSSGDDPGSWVGSWL